MDLTVETQAIRELLKNLRNEDIVIFLSEVATRDAMAAALGLYLSLKEETSRTVKVVYPRQPTVGWSHLVGINKVIQKTGNKNFIISLDYVEGSIEKVSYNIDGDKFNLVIEPKSSTGMFSEKNVHYNYSGLTAGLIISIGIPGREQLEKQLGESKKLLDEKPVVVFDINPGNKLYGKINLVRPVAGYSELLTQFLKSSQLPVTPDCATNLYDGLLAGSRNFSVPSVSAHTFEAAAFLMQKGARKPQPAFLRGNEELPRQEFSRTPDEEIETPPDWLKPKIFKGGSSLL